MLTTTLKQTVYQSRSPEETMAVAAALAERYPDGACFYLEGDLGAGKTIFAKGLASAFGVDPSQVVSPTFALVNRYGGGHPIVYHVDLYRIESERELIELGLEEIEDGASVLIIEWPEKLGPYRRDDAIVVELEVLENDSRQLRITEP
jgi:tRNA threonylcarbamoyladenosine biosynthesis protein TsaE